MRVIYNDDVMEITHQPGDGREAVVSFAGTGMALGGIQMEEFRKSLSGRRNEILFVKDKRRHWYNATFARIVSVLNRVLDHMAITDTVTIGNSMGGFGAIAFAGHLKNCRSALAFSPQSCVDPTIVPWENRYTEHTGTVEHWSGLDATRMLSRDVGYTLLFGSADALDIRHARRFLVDQFPTLSVYVVDGVGHDLAAELKRRGRLQDVIDDVLLGRSGRNGQCAALEGLKMFLASVGGGVAPYAQQQANRGRDPPP